MMLLRKLIRDLRRHPGQALALALVFTLGVSAFGGVRMAYQGLTPATEDLYRRLALPDLLAQVVFAPARVIDEVAALPGVRAVEGRIGLDTTAEGHPGVTVRVVSLPAPAQPELGKVELVRGRYLSGAPGEILLAEGGARYHQLELDDTLTLRAADGNAVPLRVVGVVRQPEHLSMIPPGGFMAMPRSYLVGFVAPAQAESLLGRRGGVTELALALEPGSDPSEVERAVRDQLARYRVTLTRGRDLASVRNVRVHLETIGAGALVFPIFFLLAGAFGGFILLSRVVRQERTLIGLLRANGYSSAAIARHYLGYTLLLAAGGGLLGLPLSIPLARYIRGIFAADLGTPPADHLFDPLLLGVGLALALLGGAAAGLVPALAASRIPPAEAMRDAPAGISRIVGRLQLQQLADVRARMALRSTLRNPLRTLLTALGITFAVGLALAPALLLGDMNRIERRVQEVRRYDLRVVPRFPQTEAWAAELAAVPGVDRVETVLELPVEVDIGGETIRTYVLGIGSNGRLLDLPTPAPGEALLARGLPAPEPGQPLELRGPLSSIELEPAGEVDYPLARPLLVRLDDAQRLITLPAALKRLLQGVLGSNLPALEDPVTAVLLEVAPGQSEAVAERLAARPEVARVDSREVERQDLQRIFRLTRAFVGVIELFALLLGLSLLYNTVVVNALERRRELATLRVIGLQTSEVSGVFLVEVLATALLGLLLGTPLGLWVARASMGSFPDFLPGGVSLQWQMVLLVALGTVVGSLLSAWPALRELGRLDLAEVVRQRT